MFIIAAPPTLNVIAPAAVESQNTEQDESETYTKVTMRYVDGTVIIITTENGETSIYSNKPLLYDESQKKVRVQTPDDVERSHRMDS